jgi:endonuclease G
MKRLVLLTLPLLLSSSNLIDDGEILIDAGIYTVLYSEKLEQPKEVWYEVKCSRGTFSRKGLDFYTNDSIHTSSSEDYEKNVWDKGHMAPAANFSCDKENLRQTFSYLNCALQHEKLNRGVWKNIESRERDLAKTKRVKVHISIIFTKNSEKLSTGATVPFAFKKQITVGSEKETYYFKNELPLFKDHLRYKI